MSRARPPILAIIPARGGSKRLPGKNIRLLAGRPLLAYSILTARACSQIGSVVVSSDDPTILQLAHTWGAEAILRPEALAHDWAPIIFVMQHALELVRLSGWQPDHVALFQPINPLRRVADVEAAIEQYLESGAESALSVSSIQIKTGRCSAAGWFQPQYPVGSRKQELAPLDYENGALYLARADLVARGVLLGTRTHALHLQPESGIASIESEFDFHMAEALYQQLDYEAEFSRLTQISVAA